MRALAKICSSLYPPFVSAHIPLPQSPTFNCVNTSSFPPRTNRAVVFFFPALSLPSLSRFVRTIISGNPQKLLT